MLNLLALALLALPCAAQSGTLTIPASLTNNVTNVSALLPPLDPGNTRWRLAAYSTFDLFLGVESTHAAPFAASAVFCADLKITSGAIDLTPLAQRRARIDLVCDFGYTSGATRVTLNTGGTFSANIQTLVGPFMLRNSTRQSVYTEWPFGQGSVVHQTISASATILEFEGRP